MSFTKTTSNTASITSTGRKRKTPGIQEYSCKTCPNWTPTASKYNAIYHYQRFHPSSESELSQQRLNEPNTSLSRHLLPSISSLRRTFNRDIYKEALIGLITRRRVAFTCVEWPEMQALLLAANPEYSDYLVKSRRSLVRLMAANYVLYRDQLRDILKLAHSPIHLQIDI
jgi:hypothetical protein